jgi:GDP-mannose 6-dehydrogenase
VALYSAFLSYSGYQSTWVRNLAKLLKALGFRTFVADGDISPGQDIVERIGHGIRNSEYVVFIISPEALKSPWTNLEINSVIAADPGGDRLIPVLLEPVPEYEIPTLLRSKDRVDLTNPATAQEQFELLLRTIGVTSSALPPIPPRDRLLPEQTPGVSEVPAPAPLALGAVNQRRIALFGMGYIGLGLASLFMQAGHRIYGVESNQSKVESLKGGVSHLLEPGVNQLLEEGKTKGLLVIPATVAQAVAEADLAVICVGPLLRELGATRVWDTSRFERVLEEIGGELSEQARNRPLAIVICATLQPDDCNTALRILNDRSGADEGVRFGLLVSPIFAREGSMLADLRKPPFWILGTTTQPAKASKFAVELWQELLGHITAYDAEARAAPLEMTMRGAALLKLASNAFHALKIGFANEVGRLGLALNVDPHSVMEAFKLDKSLNASDAYLRPGEAFGGSCLGKDLHSLILVGEKKRAGALPLIGAVLASNAVHITAAKHKIEAAASARGGRDIGFLGLAFKAGTDDLRDSSTLEVIKQIGRGFRVYAFDPGLDASPGLQGENERRWKEMLEHHGIQMLYTVAELAKVCPILVWTNSASIDPAQLFSLLDQERHVIVDLVGEVGRAGNAPCRVETVI